MMEHESKLQTESMEFQHRMEQDRFRFESELTQCLQQQSQQFQVQILHSHFKLRSLKDCSTKITKCIVTSTLTCTVTNI